MKSYLFDDIIEGFEVNNSKKLDNLINHLKSNKVYILLVFLDFTYLNKKTNSYDSGNYLKNSVLKYLDENKNVLYYTVVSSKIFIFTSDKGNENFDEVQFKKDLNQIQIQMFQKFREFDVSSKKRVLYIVDREDNSNNKFTVNSFTGNIVEYCNIIFNIENKLTNQRNFFQDYIKKVDKIESEEKLEILYHEYLNIFNISESNSFLYFDQNNFYNQKHIEELFGNKNFKNSTYIKEILKSILNSIEYNDKSFYENVIKINIIKYFLWLHMQKLLLLSFKIEKVYTYFNRLNIRTNEMNVESLVKINDNHLIEWFNSTIKVIPEIYLDGMQIARVKAIEIAIVNYSQDQSKKNAFELNILVKRFFEELKLKGAYNIPFENIKPSHEALQFFKKLLYVNFASNYKLALQNWLNSSYVKNGYYLFTKEPKDMFYTNKLFNEDFFKLVESNKFQCYIHSAFLEIDGFNAFNTYYFPNDTDDIIYKKILDEIFVIAGKYLDKNLDLFRTINFSALGDEFFFSFLSNEKLDKNEKNIIKDYLNDVRNKILEIAKGIKFPITEKVEVETKNNGSVVFRKVLEKRRFRRNIVLELGSLGVSGLVQLNHKYLNTKDFFDGEIDILSSQMDELKNSKNKGKLKELR